MMTKAMDEATREQLRKAIQTDTDTGLDVWRSFFFDALDAHRFDQNEILLAMLDNMTSPQIQQVRRHYQAALLSEQRQFDRSESLLRELLDEALTPDQRGRTQLELAILLDELGHWPDAEAAYHEAITHFTAQHDAMGQAKVYNNLGICIANQVKQQVAGAERLSEAIRCHQTAMELAAGSDALDKAAEQVKNWHGLGKAYGLMGEYALATDAFQRYIRYNEATDDDYSRGYALTDLAAFVHLPQGRLAEARTTLEQAVALLRQDGDILDLADALTHRGVVAARQDDDVQALRDFGEAMDLIESLQARLAAPIAKADARAVTEFVYAAPLTFHLERGDAAAAFSITERSRSRVLAGLLEMPTIQPRSQVSPELLAQRHALRTKVDQHALQNIDPQNIDPQGIDPQDINDEEMDALEADLAALDRRIELAVPAYAMIAGPSPLEAEAVCNHLADDELVLAYAADANGQIWVFALDKSGVFVTPAGNASLHWWETFLQDHLAGSRQGSLLPHPDTFQLRRPLLFPALFDAFLRPVQAHWERAKTVFFVPTGPLHYVPLGSLTEDAAGAPPLLSPGRRVVYAPSVTILFSDYRGRQPSSHGASSQQGRLVLAPADDMLRFTQDAAHSIAGGSEDACLVGAAATRQALLAQAGSYRTLCFLGHANYDSRFPMASHLRLADGLLRAGEIMEELRLQADLVVLAACESGRSSVLRGDELLGLNRALLYAGASAVLATLWPVHEIPTRLLIERFFDELATTEKENGRHDPSAALAKAQRWLRRLSYQDTGEALQAWPDLTGDVEDWLRGLWQMTHPNANTTIDGDGLLFAHPFFWSPFILFGRG